MYVLAATYGKVKKTLLFNLPNRVGRLFARIESRITIVCPGQTLSLIQSRWQCRYRRCAELPCTRSALRASKKPRYPRESEIAKVHATWTACSFSSCFKADREVGGRKRRRKNFLTSRLQRALLLSPSVRSELSLFLSLPTRSAVIAVQMTFTCTVKFDSISNCFFARRRERKARGYNGARPSCRYLCTLTRFIINAACTGVHARPLV